MFWIVNLVGGPRRVNHSAVAVGDFIYSFGGYCSGEDYKSNNPIDIHILNTQNLRWSLVPVRKDESGVPLKFPEIPFQRYGHTAVTFEGKIYLWGGRNDEIVCGTLYCFDTKTMKFSRPKVTGVIPGARDGHSACIYENYMYIFGGFEQNIDQFSCDVHRLNLTTFKWDLLITHGDPPSYRDFHSGTIINDKMYIFGGRGDVWSPHHSQEEIYCPRIVYLDLNTNTWNMPETTGKEPIGRRSHSAFIFNKIIYIFGGYNGNIDNHFNDLYGFDPVKNVWHLVKTKGHNPMKRRRQSCIVIGSRMYLFGGTCPVNISPLSALYDYNDMHVLDFEPSLKTLALIKVIENKLDQTWLPQGLRLEIRWMTTPNSISRQINSNG